MEILLKRTCSADIRLNRLQKSVVSNFSWIVSRNLRHRCFPVSLAKFYLFMEHWATDSELWTSTLADWVAHNGNAKQWQLIPSIIIKATLLKSHFGMGVLLYIFIFSEHLFLRATLEDCFWNLLFRWKNESHYILI